MTAAMVARKLTDEHNMSQSEAELAHDGFDDQNSVGGIHPETSFIHMEMLEGVYRFTAWRQNSGTMYDRTVCIEEYGAKPSPHLPPHGLRSPPVPAKLFQIDDGDAAAFRHQ